MIVVPCARKWHERLGLIGGFENFAAQIERHHSIAIAMHDEQRRLHLPDVAHRVIAILHESIDR